MKSVLAAMVVSSMIALVPRSADAFCRSETTFGDDVRPWIPFVAGDIPVFFNPDLDGIGNPALPLDVVVDQLRIAIRLWNEQAPASAHFVLVGPSTEDKIPGAVIVRREPMIETAGGMQGFCGLTALACAGPLAAPIMDMNVDGGGMWIRPGFSWAVNPGPDESAMLASTIAHEFGHLLTIAHPWDCEDAPFSQSTLFNAINGKPAGVYREDAKAVRSVYATAGFVLEDMRYSSDGALGTWEREIDELDAPALPLTVSNTTATLSTWEDRRVLAYPSIFPAGDSVAVKPGQGDSWGSFQLVTTEPIGVSHSPVGVSVVEDDILVAWLHEPERETPVAYVAISRNFGLSFEAPVQLEMRDPDTGDRVPFETLSASGFSVEYVESTDSWVVLGTDSVGLLAQWEVRRTGAVLTGTTSAAATQQRPTVVCGRDGRRLDPQMGFPLPLECMVGLGGAEPLQALRYMPAAFFSFAGPNRLAGNVIFETNLSIEYSTSFLWRTEPVPDPLWLGQTYAGHSNVILFNRTADTEVGDSWLGASAVPIAITGTPKPLTAPSLGLTQFGDDDVLQFVVGELFP